ncbi:MAG: hypothetical protein Q4P22_06155 [Eubacteriales bacterium]|nr:hypothetical protein [Eubacteriales bacterium]
MNVECARHSPNDDELLFANNEIIKLTGCNDMEEFFAYMGRSFRKLIDKHYYSK